MISIIIPSRNEQYLQKTVDDLLSKAEGEIEIIVVLDGYWADPMPTIPLPYGDTPLDLPSKKVVILHRGSARGMRNGINSAVAISKGEYILKTDAHCSFDVGFDIKLCNDIDSNWVVVPRRKRLDAERWCIQDVGKPDVDYMYLSYPYRDGELVGLHGVNWDERNKRKDLRSIDIDDLMTSQGSCWFMKKDFYNYLELLDEEHYGSFWSEFQEIGLKCWLSGGRVVVNKKTWYAHLHKKRRGYDLLDSSDFAQNYVMKWMNMGEAWHKQTLGIEWLIDKFSPIPGWVQ